MLLYQFFKNALLTLLCTHKKCSEVIIFIQAHNAIILLSSYYQYFCYFTLLNDYKNSAYGILDNKEF